MEEITSHGFDEHIRKSLLNSGHGFDTDKLNHARSIFDHALVASQHTTLKKGHFDDALRRMEEHPDWKRLTEHQQEAFVSTLKKNLKIADSEPTD